MGLLKEGLFAFRGRRFVEWLFMDRPQIPLVFGFTFYTLLYLHYKYDLIARWNNQSPYNDYSYVKEAAESECTHRATLSPLATPSSQSSSVTMSLSSTGTN